MDVVYVVPTNYAEMTLTPGQFLEVELKRLGLDKAKLAHKLGIRHATVSDWCNGKGGFDGPSAHNRKNRRDVARALDLPDEHFELPTETTLHRLRCDEALADFLKGPTAPKDITEEEMTNLRDTMPPITKEPTAAFYEAYLFLIRNRLQRSRYAEELAENKALTRQVEEKLGNDYEAVAAEARARAKKVARNAQKRAGKKPSPHR